MVGKNNTFQREEDSPLLRVPCLVYLLSIFPSSSSFFPSQVPKRLENCSKTFYRKRWKMSSNPFSILEAGLFSNKIQGVSAEEIDDLQPSYTGKMVVASCIKEGSSLKAYHMVKVEDFLGHWTAYQYITNSKKWRDWFVHAFQYWEL